MWTPLITGRFDETLRIAEAVLDEDDQDDFARRSAALALAYRGEFERALSVIDCETSDATRFFDETSLIQIRQTRAGQKMIESMRRRHEETFRPVQLLTVAAIHLWAGDPEAAAAALDEIEAMQLSQPAIERSLHDLRAQCAAAAGDEASYRDELERMWTLTPETTGAPAITGRPPLRQRPFKWATERATTVSLLHAMAWRRGTCPE